MRPRLPLGLATIGQAPRDDIVPGMLKYLPPKLQVLQAGALDGLSAAEVSLLAPEGDDYVLISRMADGSPATIARRHVVPRLEAAIRRLEDEGCEAVAVLCTGTFPDIVTRKLFVEPERLFHSVCAGIAGRLRLGALIPLVAQVPQAQARWAQVGAPDAVVLAASPYGSPEPVVAAACQLRAAGAALIAMDCFGYTEEMRRLVRDATGCPVVLANAYLARVLGELVAG